MKTRNLLPVLVAGLAVTLAGCEVANPDGAAVTEEPPRRFALKQLNIPEHWADLDWCEFEKRHARNGLPKPPPWLSYCDNPRPFRTGLMTAADMREERETLKREWEAKHGTPLREAK